MPTREQYSVGDQGLVWRIHLSRVPHLLRRRDRGRAAGYPLLGVAGEVPGIVDHTSGP